MNSTKCIWKYVIPICMESPPRICQRCHSIHLSTLIVVFSGVCLIPLHYLTKLFQNILVQLCQITIIIGRFSYISMSTRTLLVKVNGLIQICNQFDLILSLGISEMNFFDIISRKLFVNFLFCEVVVMMIDKV